MSPFAFLLPPHYCTLGTGSFRLSPLWTKSDARRRGYLCCWSSATGLEMYTSLPGCLCLRNDLYCVRWGVRCSLTHWWPTDGVYIVISDCFGPLEQSDTPAVSEMVPVGWRSHCSVNLCHCVYISKQCYRKLHGVGALSSWLMCAIYITIRSSMTLFCVRCMRVPKRL